MTDKELTKTIFDVIFDVHSAVFRKEDSYIPDAIQESLADRDLTVVPLTSAMTTKIGTLLTEVATRFETTDGVLDETALAADTAAITDLLPILGRLINWGKTYIGSHPAGTGPGDDE